MKNALDECEPFQMAKYMSNWAVQSYVGISGAEKISCWWSGATAYVFKASTDGQDHVIVVYRGTDDWRDWIVNLIARPVNYCGIRCHRGFAIAHRSIWRRVLETIENLHTTALPVMFIGHSLGGAMAEISALIDQEGFSLPVVSFITYGKPNVLARGFDLQRSDTRVKDAISVVNPCDPVTMVPAIGFKPTAFQTKLVPGRNGSILLNPGNATIREIIAVRVKNHSMSEYKYRLHNANQLRHRA